jgi:hypothetical protein
VTLNDGAELVSLGEFADRPGRLPFGVPADAPSKPCGYRIGGVGGAALRGDAAIDPAAAPAFIHGSMGFSEFSEKSSTQAASTNS